MKKDRSEIVPREALAAMSTAALQDLLDGALDVETPADVNVALIKEITTILNARKGESKIDVDAAKEELVSEYLGQEMLYPADEFESEETAPVAPLRRKKRLGRVLLIAAVLVVLLVGTVQASGVNLWKAFARWTEETFEFNMAGDEPALTANETEQFAEIKRVLVTDGISCVLVPQYLPDGYVFEKIDVGPGEYTAIYKNGENSLTIQIHTTQTGDATRMEKNDEVPEKYVVNGIEYHIVSNLEVCSVTWVNEGYECSITGIPSIEDAYKMIESIYWED